MKPKLLATSALLACAVLAGTAFDAAARGGWGYRGGIWGRVRPELRPLHLQSRLVA